jgi:dihydroorotate dehydrogenase electron transfer subunit
MPPYTLLTNTPIARATHRMTLAGDTTSFTRPGQFVNIRLDGLYLRRPISVCSYTPDSLTLIYKVVGRGTAQMAALAPGATLDLLVGLGNGFDPAPARGRRIALVGGGVGVPPLYGLCDALRGEDITCVLGFRSAADAFYQAEFESLGARVIVTTEDGSAGLRGHVTEALCFMDYQYYFACGPLPMLRAVHALGGAGQLSMEERMGCGFGACMGCSCPTKAGAKRLCLEGPVLTSEEVIF